MTPKPGNRILIVEDNPSMAALYGAYIKRAGFEVELVDTGEKALASLRAAAPTALVLDLNLPDMNGKQVLEFCIAEGVPTSVIVVTTDGSIDNAVKAMRGGAYDFIVKPFSSDRLVTTVRNAVERSTLKTAVEEMRDSFGQKRFCGFLGESPAMQNVYRAISAAAPSNATIFVSGESGTGKELAARAIHNNSRRAEKAFVAINCAAITETLLESELFGHEKGAFTGAVTQKKGKLEFAQGGTVFLDEIGELPLGLQAKLLRVLQERELERVGGTRSIPVDLRVLAATNRNLEDAMKSGGFRQDLYFRLNVVALTMPSLRERKHDIPQLAAYFVEKHSQRSNRPAKPISEPARACLMAYDWPGNVRELENAIERAVVLSLGDTLMLEDLPEQILDLNPSPDFSSAKYHGAVQDLKKKLILNAVKESGGNYTDAAKSLGLHPNYLHRLIRNLNLKSSL